MSTCETFQAELSALLDGALPPKEAGALEAHITDCGACQAERDALAAVVEQVGALPRLSAPPEFAAGLWARVQAAEDADASPQATVLIAKPVNSPGPTPDVPVLPQTGDDPCAPLRADLSALIDRALPPEREAQVKTHLGECAECAATRVELQRLRDRVGGLTPLRVPPEFVHSILASVEAIEREQVDAERTARATRAKWLVRLGKVAQAAALLFIVGGGVMSAAPQNTYRRQLPGFRGPNAAARAQARRVAAERSKTTTQVDRGPAPLPASDTLWELAVTSLDQGRDATRRLLSVNAREVQQREGERSSGFYAQVPRNRVDDLHRGLAAEQSVQTSALSEQAMQAIHAEQDQVVLKSGFVLVGQLVEDGRVIRVRSDGSTVHTVLRKDVERVERANETRPVKILLHQRD